MPSGESRPTGTVSTSEPAESHWPSDAKQFSCGVKVRRTGNGRWVSQWWKFELESDNYEVHVCLTAIDGAPGYLLFCCGCSSHADTIRRTHLEGFEFCNSAKMGHAHFLNFFTLSKLSSCICSTTSTRVAVLGKPLVLL